MEDVVDRPSYGSFTDCLSRRSQPESMGLVKSGAWRSRPYIRKRAAHSLQHPRPGARVGIVSSGSSGVAPSGLSPGRSRPCRRRLHHRSWTTRVQMTIRAPVRWPKPEMKVRHRPGSWVLGYLGCPGVPMTDPQPGKQPSSGASSPLERRSRRSSKHQGPRKSPLRPWTHQVGNDVLGKRERKFLKSNGDGC